MAKKILLLLIAVMMIFCIASCGLKETEYTVTLKVDGADYGSFTASNKAVDLPTPEVPADMADTHLFDYWYYIDSNTGRNIKVTNDYFVSSPLKQDITLHAEFISILSVSYNKDDGGYYIDGLGKKGVITELVIPAEYDGEKGTHPIVGVSKDAFKNETALTKVILPDTVKSIGNGAFAGCTGLKEVYIPGDLDSVGSKVFGSVKNNNAAAVISSIEAPAEIVSQIEDKSQLETAIVNGGKKLANGCFQGASNLKKVQLADSIEYIGDAAFDHCSGITSIKIPASTEYIGLDAFAYCSSLERIEVSAANELYYSNGNNYIACRTMTVHDENYNETVLENVLIAGCKNTTISDVYHIERYAFRGAIDLTNVIINGTVLSINEEAFLGCTSISSILVNSKTSKYVSDSSNCLVDRDSGKLILGCKNTVIPESVLEISEHAFTDASDLTTLHIPAGVTEIYAGSFAGCAKLANVSIAPESTGLVINDGAFSADMKISSISVPAEYVPYFSKIASATLTSVKITSGDEVPAGAFLNCTALTTVELANSVTSISDSAFKGCVALSSLTMGSEVAEISNNAFNGCTSLATLKINGVEAESDAFVVPASVKNIGDYAFADTGITELVINNTLKNVGYNVFGNCEKLVSVSIANGVNVNRDAFCGSAAIEFASVPANVIRCLYSANESLETLTITAGEAVEAYALRNAVNLTTLVIGESVTSIDARAFEGCSNLTTITVEGENYVVEGGCLIKDGVVILGSVSADLDAIKSADVIGEYAFAGSNISEIKLSAKWTVSEHAFAGCTALATVTVENGDWTGKIGQYSFDGCDKITTAKLPTSAIQYFTWPTLVSLSICGGEEIPADAFRGCVTLETVDLGTTVTSVGENAFKGCTGIKTVVAPTVACLASIDGTSVESLTLLTAERSISYVDLSGFVQLKKINLPTDCKVNAGAFANCKGIVAANVPASVVFKMNTANLVDLTINSGSFNTVGLVFTSLEKLTVSGDAQILAQSFENAPNLASIEADSDIYTAVDGSLVKDNVLVLGSLSSKISDGVTEIGSYAFAGRAIVSVTVPENVSTIGASAFANCTALTDCTIEGAAVIGDNAFAGCTSLATVSLATGVEVSESAFDACLVISTLSAPAGAIASIKNTDNLTTLKIVSGEFNTPIWEVSSLETLVIGKDVTLVSGNALSGTNNIAGIVVEEGNAVYVGGDNCVLTADGKTLVLGCKNTVISECITTIEANAFKGCSDIKTVNIPASVTEIKANAFNGCSGIESITVAEGNGSYVSVNNAILTKDGTVLVLGCKNTVDIPETVTTIAAYAFNGVTGLETIIIPASVIEIGDGAFKYCMDLKTVVFEQGSELNYFADSLFLGCTSLENVVVPVTVEAIADDAFYGCYGVTVCYGGTKTDENVENIENLLDGAYAVTEIVYYSDEYVSGCWGYEGNSIMFF